MHRKKSWLSLASLLLIAGLLLSACGAKETQFLSLATGGTAGTYFPLGGAMAEIWNKNVKGVSVSAESTGASVANVNLMNENKADIAMLQNDIAFYAYSGTEMFAEKKVDSLLGLATLYPETIQIVATKKSGIQSVKDLKGKKVAVGARGSGTEANARQILAAFGLTYSDITPDYLGFGDAVNNLKDGHIDAAFVTAGFPTAAVTDLSSSHDIVIVAVSGAETDKLIKDYPFYAKVSIPAGTYKGLAADVPTVAVMAMLAVRKDLSEKVVYEMTKAMYENLKILGDTHARGKDINLQKAKDGMGIPLHPGAEKYFKEKGVK